MAPLGADLTAMVKGAAAGVAAGGQVPRLAPVNLVAGANTDQNGNASFPIKGWQPGQFAKWNLYLSVDGGGSFQVLIEQTSMPVGAVLGAGGVAAGGPFLTHGVDVVTLTVTGAAASSPVRATASGVQSPVLDDVINFTGPSFSSVGVFQSSPAQLIPGQVGAPLVENYANNVPGSGQHLLFVGTFDVGGYAALLVYGDPPPASQQLWAMFQWNDATGTPIAYSQLDALNPKFVAVLGCLSSTVNVWIGNAGASVHNIAGLTIIPLAEMPSQPALLIPLAGGGVPAFTVPQGPSAILLCSAAPAVAVGAPVTVIADFVWNGRAIFNYFAGAAAVYTIAFSTVDAAGVSTQIAKYSNATPPAPATELMLPSGLVNILITNTAGSGTFTPNVNLVAA